MGETAMDQGVRKAAESDAEALFATLTLAFSGDPPTRWLFPRADVYLKHYAAFARAFGGAAFAAGTALMTGDGAAAALWLAPGSTVDSEAMGEVIGAAFAARGAAAGDNTIGEQLAAFHPKEAHWYLPLIGVDPARQGAGLGSALLRAGLALCDAQRLPAYLESSNRKNIPLYERFGFEVQGCIQPGDFPGLWPMSRAARR